MTGLVLGIPAVWHLVGFDVPPGPDPNPTDVLRPGLTEWDVSPGLIGFIAMFIVVVVSVLVWFSMHGKLRRIRHDERRSAEAAGTDAEASEQSTSAADDETGQAVTAESPESPESTGQAGQAGSAGS